MIIVEERLCSAREPIQPPLEAHDEKVREAQAQWDPGCRAYLAAYRQGRPSLDAPPDGRRPV
jgi:hypothetical protein